MKLFIIYFFCLTIVCCISCNTSNPFEGEHKIVGDFPISIRQGTYFYKAHV
jgi:hypothetical protein